MNDEITFDTLFSLDPSRDSRIRAIQENLIAFETKATHAIERFMPRALAGILKKKFDL